MLSQHTPCLLAPSPQVSFEFRLLVILLSDMHFHGKYTLFVLFSRIGHQFISRVLIFAQRLKTNFRAYLFLRTAIFSNLDKPKYFKEIGFDRSFINILTYC